MNEEEKEDYDTGDIYDPVDIVRRMQKDYNIRVLQEIRELLGLSEEKYDNLPNKIKEVFKEVLSENKDLLSQNRYDTSIRLLRDRKKYKINRYNRFLIVREQKIKKDLQKKLGSPVLAVISLFYLNKQANSFSRRESKVLKP